MEVGECPRLEKRFLFLQGTAKSLMQACLFWSSERGFHLYTYMCPVGHLPSKMALNEFLPRAE